MKDILSKARYFLNEEEKESNDSVSKIDKETKFWVVTEPSEDSTIEDILFSTDLRGLVLQIKGGLSASQIVGIFFDEDEATTAAMDLVEPEE